VTFTLLSFLVVVACAFAWSGFDLARKLLVQELAPTPLLALLTLGQAPLFLGWALIEGWPQFQSGYWLPALTSVALNVVANLAFIRAFQIAPMSLVVPLLSLTPALTALLAVPLLGEIPSWRQGVGILLVVVGAFLINLRPGEQVTVPAVLRAFVRERGAHLMLVVAVSWSLAPPLDKLALQRASGPAHAFVLCALVAMVMVTTLAVQGRLRELAHVRRVPGTYAGALVVSTLALGLQFVAYNLLWVALVETVKRSVGNVLALVFGKVMFDETVGRAQLAAVLLMAAGVALILF